MRLVISEFSSQANHSKMEEHNLQCMMRNPVYVDERGEDYLRILHSDLLLRIRN
jgi:hypothetical protein